MMKISTQNTVPVGLTKFLYIPTLLVGLLIPLFGAATTIDSQQESGIAMSFGLTKGNVSGSGSAPSIGAGSGSVAGSGAGAGPGAGLLPSRVPEIDGAAAPTAIAFLLGCLALIRERSRRRF